MKTLFHHRFLQVCVLLSALILATALSIRFFFSPDPARETTSTETLFEEIPFPSTSSVTSADFVATLPVVETLPAVTLERIFAEDHSWTATLSAEKTVTLVSTGDVLLARSVNSRTTRTKDFTWPFAKTKPLLTSGDLTFINLETPLTKNCTPTQEGMIFCGAAENIAGLLFAEIDVVNLANNHAGNQQLEGVQETVNLLHDNGILVTGVQGPVYKEIKGTKMAFLGYNEVDIQPGVALAREELITKEITAARQNADIVIVAFHWGQEYTYQPTKNQKRLAHLAIDTGADVIIGHHAHWVQALEMYKDKPILYGHGNFIFDQMWSEETRNGIVSRMKFYDKKLVDIQLIPIRIDSYGQPRLMSPEESKNLIQILQRESQKLLGS